jgi:ornithine cyclodeaminase
LFDLNSSRAQSLAIHFNNVLELQNIKLNICKSAEIAIRQSQLIVALTTTTSGYIHFDWLQQGAILLNISLDDPLPEVVLRVDRIIVDDWNLIKNDDRRLLGRMYRKGLVDIEPAATARMIDAELGEIVIGKKTGRQRENDIILVNPFGLSIEDIAVAAKIFQVARKLGIGQYLER